MGYQIFTDPEAVLRCQSFMKCRGMARKQAEGLEMEELAQKVKLSRMEQGWEPELGNMVIVGHGGSYLLG